ncbi:hypothetical protein Cfor_06922 [Coptotermes formosanus]|uniref:Uncharacterized protein n=1 Tax=Coptotermes formosanus TaxID=36987 RepID=A0A6L2Q6J2_COPFO|nr:hypothetical protein Cfor_06922 [Coptotermes formosanus]
MQDTGTQTEEPLDNSAEIHGPPTDSETSPHTESSLISAPSTAPESPLITGPSTAPESPLITGPSTAPESRLISAPPTARESPTPTVAPIIFGSHSVPMAYNISHLPALPNFPVRLELSQLPEFYPAPHLPTQLTSLEVSENPEAPNGQHHQQEKHIRRGSFQTPKGPMQIREARLSSLPATRQDTTARYVMPVPARGMPCWLRQAASKEMRVAREEIRVTGTHYTQVTLVCAHGDLFWLTLKFDVKARKRFETVQYIGSAVSARRFRYRCDLLSTDEKTGISFFSAVTSTLEDAENVFTFEPHFQMDIDVFNRDFADKDGHVPGYKLTIDEV